jgi:Ca2+-binding EF-hand superfamily protein
MTRNSKLLLSAAAIVAVGATAAIAGNGMRHFGGGPMAMERFESADADKSGDVTFEEFSAAFDQRIGGADANGDGIYSADEIAAEIQKQMAQRMAERMIKRFDTDGDGKLAKAEVESHEKRMFAMLDRNADGKIGKDEVPQRGMPGGGMSGGGWGHKWHHGPWGGPNQE